MTFILHDCKRLRARISLAQCEHNRGRSDNRTPKGEPIRPWACRTCEDWKQWTKENGMTETDRIIERMMQVTGVETKRELGEIVGGNVYQATQHKRIPDRWYEHLEDKYGADVEFLKTGVHSNAAPPEAIADSEVEVQGAQPEPTREQASELPPAAQAKGSPVEHAPISPRMEVPAPASDPIILDEIPTEILIDELMERIPLATITIGRSRAW